MDYQKTSAFNSLNSRFAPTLESSIMSIFDSFKARLEVCIPAIVESANRENNTVVVNIAPNIIKANGDNIKRASIELPILIASGGGFMINFPIKEGDVGWIIAGDRDTTGYRKDNSKQYDLLSLGTHSYNFGFFIPDVLSNSEKTFKISEDDKDKLIIQTLNGNTKIKLSHDGIIDIICPTKLKITGDVEVAGKISATGDVIGEGVSLAHHIHPCGTGTTGEPNK